MKSKKGLIVLHIDGVSYNSINKALRTKKMPFIKQLIEQENYTITQYRCGIPSTTPFVQAGILLGDNREIPGFRWWDKDSGTEVRFGPNATFSRVSHKYFRRANPLTKDGACIATCFTAGAKKTFALAYRTRADEKISKTMHRKLLLAWAKNPFRVVDWAAHTISIVIETAIVTIRSKIKGEQTAFMYILGDLLDELFLHHLTRFAAGITMEDDYPIIYAAFYAYDETAHAFSPSDSFANNMLSYLDKTILYLAKKRLPHKKQKRTYELVILSDHGQVDTIPFKKTNKKELRERIGALLPTYEIKDVTGKTHENSDILDGHIRLTFAGGLAHLYFTDISYRLSFTEIKKRFPGLVKGILRIPQIACAFIREGKQILLLTKTGTTTLSSPLSLRAKRFLQEFDNPEILASQLRYLGSFKKTGDILLIGKFIKGRQINFENQAGGHGSMGKEQALPFVLGKQDWHFDKKPIQNALELHTLLMQLRKRIVS